jgi:hypothetical protein
MQRFPTKERRGVLTMDFLKSALDAIPSAATHPLAFLAYVVVVISWLAIAWKVKRLKELLRCLEKLPEPDRLQAIRLEMGSAELKTGMTAEQWIKFQRHKYFFYAFVILSLLIAFICVIAGMHTNDKIAVSEENHAVMELVQDIKLNPVVLTFFFLKKHPFIGKEWHKKTETDSYYQSISCPRNLFEISYLFAVKMNASELISPARGEFTAKVKDVDIIEENGANRIVLTVEENEGDALQEKTQLKVDDIDVYYESEVYVGEKILGHINDAYLPQSIREALQKFNDCNPHKISFRKSIENKRDFILISTVPQVLKEEKEKVKWPRDTMPLYGKHENNEVKVFINNCGHLFNTLNQWAMANGVELNLLEKPYLSPHSAEISSIQMK